MAAVAWGLTMPMFREDRMELPEALRRVEAALRHVVVEEEEAEGVEDHTAAAAAAAVSDELLRGCVICDDAPREVCM